MPKHSFVHASFVHASAIAAIAIATIIVCLPAPAKAQSSGARASETAARHSRSVRNHRNDRDFLRANPFDDIVCLKGGCRPLPPHCHAETEFTWSGPTGYQLIVCP